MSKLNLADAAKAVLMNEGAKEIFDANRGSKQHTGGTGGKAPHGEAGKDKLSTSIVTGQKDAGEVAGVVDKKDDKGGDYTKGVPTATAPGATPPLGSQPAQKLSGPAETQGSAHTVSQSDPTSYENIRDRVKAKLAKQTFQSNPGATFQSYAEEKVEEEEVVAEEKEEGHEDEAQDKALIKKMMKKSKMKEEVQSDVDALLSGEDLSEEFKQKATTIFESAVIARTASLMEEVEEALFEEFQSTVEQVKEELAQKLDDYIGYMAEEWVKDNQLAIESGLRAEIVEDFIGGLKNLFVEHYIDIPEEKVNVVEELTNKIEELEAQVNEQIQSNVALHKSVNEHKKNEAVHAVCEGLTQTQVEKMKSLAEGVEFTTDEEFADKLVTLRTSYFTESTVKPANISALNEEVIVEEDKKPTTVSVDPTIAAVASALSKTKVK
jgi:tetrahydromethanopterin S-methyltransferase subunit B